MESVTTITGRRQTPMTQPIRISHSVQDGATGISRESRRTGAGAECFTRCITAGNS